MWWVYWDGIKCGGFIGMVLNVVGFIGIKCGPPSFLMYVEIFDLLFREN